MQNREVGDELRLAAFLSTMHDHFNVFLPISGIIPRSFDRHDQHALTTRCKEVV